MGNIAVNYLGISLSSPIIAASSALTSNIDNIKALEEAGAGAIVMKSLFEEQIYKLAGALEDCSVAYPENADLLNNYVTGMEISRYTDLVSQAKKAVKIPVIASINCFDAGSWVSFAKEIERAGADALEINIYSMPLSPGKSSEKIERGEIEIIRDIVSSVSIPVAVKIGDNYTNIPEFVGTLRKCGAKGAVLFNSFYKPDIDIDTMSLISANPFSAHGSYVRELRWIAVCSSCTRGMDYSATGGIFEPYDAIKLMLAGASTVQLCSALYQQGYGIVKSFNDLLNNFMQDKGFNKTTDFIGNLNYSNIKHPESYERSQFIKVFGSRTNIL